MELSVEGVVEPFRVIQKLSVCDVLPFVRGSISSRRRSAIAGIACGLPIIAYSGSETAAPITDTGVVLVSPNQPMILIPLLSESFLILAIAWILLPAAVLPTKPILRGPPSPIGSALC